jgi:hypothetical protein
MPLMQEAMSREEWERKELGLPPLKKKKVERPEPTPPKVDKLLSFKEVPLDRFVRLISVKRNNIKNKDGVSFIGYDVEMEIKSKDKKKPLDKILSEESETYLISGWFPEGEWMQFLRHMRSRIDLSMLQM